MCVAAGQYPQQQLQKNHVFRLHARILTVAKVQCVYGSGTVVMMLFWTHTNLADKCLHGWLFLPLGSNLHASLYAAVNTRDYYKVS